MGLRSTLAEPQYVKSLKEVEQSVPIAATLLPNLVHNLTDLTVSERALV
jgi:hypothetical protein